MVTSPIFYVNAEPHIGHLYSIVLTDSIKRWFEFRGEDALCITGTDEHGLKIQEAASRARKSEQKFCDDVSIKFKNLFDKADISYTDFIRTTEPRHHVAVQAIWKRLKERGYIYKGTHEGWYSVSDETFYPATQVEQVIANDGSKAMVAKETGKRVEWTSEDNYKFRLGKTKDALLQWLENNPDAIIPKPQYNSILQSIKTNALESLADLSISRPRSRLSWGISVPDDPEHVVYVWLDALTNYLTVTGYPWNDRRDEVYKTSKNAWPADCHVVGKDIIKFHAIYWPAFLIAADLPLPSRIVSHAHWLQDNTKMSKSLGNITPPTPLIDKYGIDVVRYFLLRDGGLENDAEFGGEYGVARRHRELAGQLGNLVMRCSGGVVNPGGVIPLSPGAGGVGEAEGVLVDMLKGLRDKVTLHFEAIQYSKGLECILDTIHETNRYWNQSEPWKLASLLANPEADSTARAIASKTLRTALFMCFETMRIAALLMQPVMPGKTRMLLDAMDVPRDERGWDDAVFRVNGKDGGDGAERRIPLKMEPMFPKIKS